MYIKIFAKFQRFAPAGALNRGGVWKYRNFRPITCYISKTVVGRWVHAASLRGVWQALNSLSIHVTFPRLSEGVHRGGQNVQKNVLKWRIFKIPAWITGKRLKIDGYIQRGFFYKHWILFRTVWHLPRLSQGRTWEAKMCKNVLKWRIFRLQAWITGKQLKTDGYIQRGVLQALNPLSNRVTFTAIVPGATPYGGVECKRVGKSCDFRPISRYSS